MKNRSYTVRPQSAEALRKALQPFAAAGVAVMASEPASKDVRVTIAYAEHVAARVERAIFEWYVDWCW